MCVRHGWLVLQMALLLLFPWVFGQKYYFLTILIHVAWMWVNFNSLVQLAEIEFVPKVKKWKLKFLSRLSDMQHFWLIKFRLSVACKKTFFSQFFIHDSSCVIIHISLFFIPCSCSKPIVNSSFSDYTVIFILKN